MQHASELEPLHDETSKKIIQCSSFYILFSLKPWSSNTNANVIATLFFHTFLLRCHSYSSYRYRIASGKRLSFKKFRFASYVPRKLSTQFLLHHMSDYAPEVIAATPKTKYNLLRNRIHSSLILIPTFAFAIIMHQCTSFDI